MASRLEVRTLSIWAHLFDYGLDEIRRAYDGARESSDRALSRLELQWEELERDVAAGNASFVEEDEEGRVVYDRGEHAGEMKAEIDGALRIVREAFVISLHHFWEREIAAKMRTKHYDEAKAFAFLKTKGLKPDETLLSALRLSANVAKHNTGASANQLYSIRPDLFDAASMTRSNDPPGYEYLRIQDADVETFFEAVRSSGPQRHR